MNLQEFAALKVGDKIENAMTSSQGVVTETTSNGVRVTWGPLAAFVAFSGFLYPAHSTAWMHWSRVIEAIEDRPDGVA